MRMRGMVFMLLSAVAIAAEPSVVVREGTPVPVVGKRQAPAPSPKTKKDEKRAADYDEEVLQAEVTAAKTGLSGDALKLWMAHLNRDLFNMRVLAGRIRPKLDAAERLEADAAKVDDLPELPELESQAKQFQLELDNKKAELDRLSGRLASLDALEKERLLLLEQAIEKLTEAVRLSEEALRTYPELRKKARERGDELRRLAARERAEAELAEADASVAAARASVSLVKLLGVTNDVAYEGVRSGAEGGDTAKRRGCK